jgi:hypothetical protein
VLAASCEPFRDLGTCASSRHPERLAVPDPRSACRRAGGRGDHAESRSQERREGRSWLGAGTAAGSRRHERVQSTQSIRSTASSCWSDQITRDATRTQSRIKHCFERGASPRRDVGCTAQPNALSGSRSYPRPAALHRPAVAGARRTAEAQTRCREAADRGASSPPDQHDLGDVPRLRPDSHGARGARRGDPKSIPHVATALVVLGPRHRHAISAGRRTRRSVPFLALEPISTRQWPAAPS